MLFLICILIELSMLNRIQTMSRATSACECDSRECNAQHDLHACKNCQAINLWRKRHKFPSNDERQRRKKFIFTKPLFQISILFFTRVFFSYIIWFHWNFFILLFKLFVYQMYLDQINDYKCNKINPFNWWKLRNNHEL